MATTDRLALPLLTAAQAQKEMTHNEALAALDALVQAVATAVANDPPANPVPGQCWIVGGAPTGAWTGQATKLAAWTQGGWRFHAPVKGMRVWDLAAGVDLRWTGSAWVSGLVTADRVEIAGNQVVGPRLPSIASPTGGTTIDSESRAAVGSILAALRTHGLIAS